MHLYEASHIYKFYTYLMCNYIFKIQLKIGLRLQKVRDRLIIIIIYIYLCECCCLRCCTGPLQKLFSVLKTNNVLMQWNVITAYMQWQHNYLNL